MAAALKTVEDTITKCEELNKFITEGYQVTKNIAEECETDENGKELMNELRDMVFDYARMERDVAQYCSAAQTSLGKFRADYAKCGEDENIPDLYSIFEETLSSMQATNVDEQIQKNKEVVEFTQTMWSIHNPDSMMTSPKKGDTEDDDEIQMTQLDDSHKFICPITKIELVDPVKSKLCGHTFSRKAVEAHINLMQSRAKCPIAGCISTISNADLEANNILAFQLRKRNRNL